jgi:uroporphyrinogen decarboxylase
MNTLTSRERVRRALNHEETDRVPVDFGASRITGIAAIAYKNLLRHLGRQEDIRVYDIKQQLAQPSLAMIERMGGDVVQLHRLGPTSGMPFLKIDDWKSGCLTDGSPCLVPVDYSETMRADGTVELRRDGQLCAWRAPESFYFDVCYAPLAQAETLADIDAFVWPDPWTEREEHWLKQEVSRLHQGTDKALFAGLPMFVCSFFELSLVLWGFENFMMKLATERDLVEHWFDVKLAHDLAILEKFLAVAGPYIEAIQMNDDLGTQESLQVSPKLYRELIKPRQRKWIEFVKARTNAKVFIHCDGAIEPILPDFIEIGIDVLNPLQTSARGMDPRVIKQKYGRNLSFWGGGVETQTTLPFGTVEDVRREVRERMKLLSQGGGYVFAPIHNIQPDIPPEKVLAIFDTAAECAAAPL